MSDVTRIAIITSNKNYARYIEDYIESVVTAAKDAESICGPLVTHFFIGDNGSTDNSKEILEASREKHATANVQFTLGFLGGEETQNGIFNRMIRTAVSERCKYGVVLDTDDCLTPPFFKKTLPRLQKERATNDRVGYVYTNLQFTEADLTPIRMGLFEEFAQAATECGQYCIPTPALVTMDCLASVQYDPNILCSINQQRYRKLYKEKGWVGIHVPEIGFRYRMHGNNLSEAYRLVHELAPDGDPTKPIYVKEVWAREMAGVS